VEAEVGDIPSFESSPRKLAKAEREQQAIVRIRDMLEPTSGTEIFELFQEYELCASLESRFAKALDNLEVQIQHNLADLSTWEEIEYALVYTKMDPHCGHDRFLRELCEAVKLEGEEKMKAGGIDVEAVRRNLSLPR